MNIIANLSHSSQPFFNYFFLKKRGRMAGENIANDPRYLPIISIIIGKFCNSWNVSFFKNFYQSLHQLKKWD